VQTATLCSCMVETRGGFLKKEVVVTREDCPCDVEDILEVVENLTLGPVGVHGNESFMKGLLVLRVESMPEDGIVLADSYPTSAKENLALVVELLLVVDDIGLVTHTLLGILGGKIDKLLP